MNQSSEVRPYLPASDPLTIQLQTLISQNALEKDILSQAKADVFQYVANFKNTTNDALQEVFYRINSLLPRLVQPALILFQRHQKSQMPTEGSLIELIKELEQLLALLQPLDSKYLASLITTIKEVYDNVLQKWMSDEQLRPSLLIPKPQMTGTSLGFYYLDLSVARQLLCRNHYNIQIKTNQSGCHAVANKNGVHFKPNPMGMMGLSPAMEYAMFSFSTLLAGNDLAAPTTIIKISDVWAEEIVKPSEKEDDLTAYNEFQHQIQIGIQPEKILEDKALANSLIIKSGMIESVVQSGQTVEGIALDTLLTLIDEYEWLKTVLPNFLYDFDTLLNKEGLLQDFLKENPFLRQDLSIEELFQYFIKIMTLREKEFHFLDFRGLGNNLLLHDFKSATLKYTPKVILTVFAMITKWPAIASQRNFGNILKLVKLLEYIPFLFPKLSSAEIHQQMPLLFNKFDRYNLSGHYFTTYLTNPSDAKADNYLVKIKRDAQQRIERLIITIIDGDKALADDIALQKKHYVGVKSVILGFPTGDEPIDDKFRQQFLNKTPEMFMIQWLRALYLQNQRYERLLKLGVINNTDLVDSINASMLDIPLRVEPTAIKKIYQKYKVLFSLLQANSAITFREILFKLNPLLAEYYARITASKGSPMKVEFEVYKGTCIEDTLSDLLDTKEIGGKTYRQMLNEITVKEGDYETGRTQLLEDAIQLQFVDQLDLVNQSAEQIAQLLKLVAFNFPFINHLPLEKDQLNQWLHYAIENGVADLTSLLLRAGADVNCPNAKGQPPLHVAVGLEKHSISVINALLSDKNLNINGLDKAGYPAIFYCSRKANLIKTLEQSGADLEIMFKDSNITLVQNSSAAPLTVTAQQGNSNPFQDNNITLLDYMVKKNKPDEFVELIKAGAGQRVNPTAAFLFIKRYRDQPQWSAKMEDALKRLSNKSSKVGWLAALDSVFEPSTPQDDVRRFRVDGMGLGSFILNDEVLKQIYDEKGNIRRPNAYGRHPVPKIMHKGQDLLRTKFLPEIPLMEPGMNHLSHLLFGESLTPENGLFRFPGPKGSIPVLVSTHISGDNLQEIFNNNEKYNLLETKLSQRYYTMLYLLILLTNSADGKPDQFIFTPIFNEKGEIIDYKIMTVDNEQSLVDPVKIGADGHRELLVKSIIYCLNNMLKELDQGVRAMFLAHNMRQLLEKLFGGMIDQQEFADQAFSRKDRERLYNDKENPVILRVPFKKGMAASIYEKALLIQEIWRAQPHLTGMSLLLQVIPLLGKAYEKIFTECDNPAGRFKILHGKMYSAIVTDVVPFRYGTVVTGKQLLRTQNISDEAMLAAKSDYTPGAALAELRRVDEERKLLDKTTTKLLSGDIDSFNGLLLDGSKQSVLDGITISELPLKLQLQLLNALKTVSLKTLRLTNCQNIDDKLLAAILENSPNLTILDISNCSKITPKVFAVISKYCPLLKRLNANKLPQLTQIKGDKNSVLEFPQLQYLQLNETSLESIQMIAPCLKGIFLNQCPKLTKIDIQGKELEECEHTGPSTLPPEQLERLMGQSPALLKKPQLDRCQVVTRPHILAKLLNGYANCALWSEQSVRLIYSNGNLNLGGLHLSRDAITKIAIHTSNQVVKQISLGGNSTSLIDSVTTVIRNMPSGETLSLPDDYDLPTAQPKRLLFEPNLTTFEVGFQGELYTATFDKSFGQWGLMSGTNQWQSTTPTKQKSFMGHEKSIRVIIRLPNGDLVTGAYDRAIKIWNSLTGECLRTFKGHTGRITALAVSKNVLVSASEDKTIRHWNIETGECTKTAAVDPDIIQTIKFVSPDVYATGSNQGKLSFWDLSGRSIKVLQVQSPINAIEQTSPDHVATAHDDKRIRVWNWKTGAVSKILEGHKGSVNALQLLHERNLLASGSFDKTIALWDLVTGECIGLLKGHTQEVSMLKLLPTGELLSGSQDGTIHAWQFPNKDFDLQIFSQTKIPLAMTKNERSITVLCAENQMALLCQELIFKTVGRSAVKITLKNNELFIETIVPEKYKFIEELLSVINIRISPWQSSKPKTIRTESSSMISRSSNTPRTANFFRGSNDIAESRSPSPVLAGSSGRKHVNSAESRPASPLLVGAARKQVAPSFLGNRLPVYVDENDRQDEVPGGALKV